MFLKKNNSMDFKKLGFVSIFVVILTVLGFVFLDTAIQPFFRKFDFSFWRIFDFIAEWQILAIITLSIFAVAKLIHKEDLAKIMGNSFVAIVFSEIISFGLNVLVGRMRPVIFDALGQTGFSPFSISDIWHSFPSGQIAAIFALLVSIGLVYKHLRPITYGIAIFAGISRICLGYNFPSDVFFAAFIGMVSADLVVSLRKKLTNK